MTSTPLPPPNHGHFQRQAIKKSLNRIMNILMDDNPNEKTETIIEEFLKDNKNLTGISKLYVEYNLDDKTRDRMIKHDKRISRYENNNYM